MVLNQLIKPPPGDHVVAQMCPLGCGHRFNTYVNCMAHAQVTRYGRVGHHRPCHLYEAIPFAERSLHQGSIFHLVDESVISAMIRTIQRTDVSWGSVDPGVEPVRYMVLDIKSIPTPLSPTCVTMADHGSEHAMLAKRRSKKLRRTGAPIVYDIYSLVRAKHHYLTHHSTTIRSTLSMNDEHRFVRPQAHPPLSEVINAQFLLPMCKWPDALMASYGDIIQEE